MAQTDFKTVDEFLSTFSGDVRLWLEEIRQTIRNPTPGAEEEISYRAPTFRLHGILVHFAAFRNHISLFPTPSAVAAFREQLSAYETSKGKIKFPGDRPLPHKRITQNVKFRIRENMDKNNSSKDLR